jgi:hypothetical protein
MKRTKDDRQGKLVSAAEIVPSLPAKLRRELTLSRVGQKLLSASVNIRQTPPEDIAYQHTVLCQTSMPYRSTSARTWTRRNGKVILHMEAGSGLDPVNEKYIELPLPYGPKARLILLYLNTAAIRTQSRVIEAEGSMTSFIRELQSGREPNGDEIKKFQQQLRALAKARINLGVVDSQRSLDGKLDIVESFDVWFSKDTRQRVLWTSTVELSQKYFDTLIKHAVPLDPRGIAALSHSALALDLYTWLAQRLHRIGNKPELATWANLQEQLGDSYKEIRMLRRAVNNALADVKTQYPDAHFETDQRGITLFNSPPPVRRKLVQIAGS